MRLPNSILTSLIGTLIGLTGVVVYALFVPLSLPKEGAIFYVQPRVSRATLVTQLSADNLVRLPPLFDLYTLARNKVPRSGEYKFPQGSSPYTIWKQIMYGTGHYYRSFTIIPGTTYKQIKAALLKEPTFKHILDTMSDKDVMAVLGDTTHTPEGMFMPETYHYSRGDVDLVILKRAHDLMDARIKTAWEGRAANVPYTDAYQALIAASLIEKEAYLAKEQPIISGVLVNRLKKNMLLQFDPTIIYGLGDSYKGKIYKSDLIKDTPYNSYLHKGLPPTPIAMPGMGAIQAAMHPAQHDFLYFVAAGDGSHTFTSNLPDHNAAVMRARQNIVPPAPTPAAGAAHAAS